MTLTLWEPEIPETHPEAISFVAYGEAKPGGSKRAFKHPQTGRILVVEDSDSKPWRQQIAGAALDVIGDGARPVFDCPVFVTMTFYRPRPKGHYGSGVNAGRVKPGSPQFPSTRPDVLKLARAAEDALTSIVYRDDAQIVEEMLRKRWGDPARLEITVRPI